MKAEVFDERRNLLGESPTSSGLANELITWVDITGKKVRAKHFATGIISEYETTEDIGFAIPRKGGGEIIGVTSGPLLRDPDGTLHKVPNRQDADGYVATREIRWNDAKVSPQGDLFLGTMGYNQPLHAAALYQLRGDGKHIRRLFGDVTCSNGLGWSTDGETMYYIDSALNRVDIFDVEEREIKNRRTLVSFSEKMGHADGMSVDMNNNLWIGFWNGSHIRSVDGISGEILDEVYCPVPKVTSCTFGGKELDRLFITTASESTDLAKFPEAGMVFTASPGVKGQATIAFGG